MSLDQIGAGQAVYAQDEVSCSGAQAARWRDPGACVLELSACPEVERRTKRAAVGISADNAERTSLHHCPVRSTDHTKANVKRAGQEGPHPRT